LVHESVNKFIRCYIRKLRRVAACAPGTGCAGQSGTHASVAYFINC